MRIPRLAALAGAAVVVLASLTACGSDGGSGSSGTPSSAYGAEGSPSAGATAETPAETPAEATGEPGAGVACQYVAGASAAREVDAPPAQAEVSGDMTAVLDTSAGDLAITLTANRTPCTVGSFVSLAEQGYYDDTPCHRLTTSGIYVLQCGDPSGSGRGGPGYSYADELDGTETYPAGTVAMANAGPNTNGSQFFLVYDESPLPPSYTVFGQMDEASLATLRTIAEAGTATGGGDGAPAEAVTIKGVTIG